MKEVKYLGIKVGEHTFMVKLTYVAGGGFFHEDIVKIRIMDVHNFPQTFWEKIFENFVYPAYDTHEYSPFGTEQSLEDYCKTQCTAVARKQDSLTKVKKEWDKI